MIYLLVAGQRELTIEAVGSEDRTIIARLAWPVAFWTFWSSNCRTALAPGPAIYLQVAGILATLTSAQASRQERCYCAIAAIFEPQPKAA